MKTLASVFKMSGTGNTFVLVDGRKNAPWTSYPWSQKSRRIEFAKNICGAVTGAGTDGVLFIEEGSDGADFNWDFYNSDGSGAEMCGNAARCAAIYCAQELGLETQKAIVFKTGAGLVRTELSGENNVRVHMPIIRVINAQYELRTKSSSVEKFALINSGVPHLVQKIHDFHDVEDLKELAREVRSHEDLLPAGANVTFYADASEGKIRAVTYERGVEGYTLACGTGAVAAAKAVQLSEGRDNVQVQMPGGILSVVFSTEDAHPIMTGEAHFVAEIKMNEEVFK